MDLEPRHVKLTPDCMLISQCATPKNITNLRNSIVAERQIHPYVYIQITDHSPGKCYDALIEWSFGRDADLTCRGPREYPPILLSPHSNLKHFNTPLTMSEYSFEYFTVQFPTEHNYVAHVEINRPERLNAFIEV